MAKFNAKKVLKDLLSSFANEHEKIDFRTHVYLENNYGGTQIFSYSFAEKIVVFAYDYVESYLEDNKNHFPDFSGWVWNKQMSIEKLRTTTLKAFLESLIDDLERHYS